MTQKIVIKVPMRCEKCRTKALKIAAIVYGVISVAIEGEEGDRVVIVGDDVDSANLVTMLRKKMGHASLVSVEEVKEKPNPDHGSNNQINQGHQFPQNQCSRFPICYTYQVVHDSEQPNCSII